MFFLLFLLDDRRIRIRSRIRISDKWIRLRIREAQKNTWILRIRIRNTALKALPQKGQLNSLEVNSCTLRTCRRSAYIAELYTNFLQHLFQVFWESGNMVLGRVAVK
jgi:hypothetical protein